MSNHEDVYLKVSEPAGYNVDNVDFAHVWLRAWLRRRRD